jgi:lambda family phage portal protein
MNFLDRVIMWGAPKWGQSRQRARLVARHYESASVGRRTDGWSRRATDANTAASGVTLSFLRAQARDLVRNNPWARRGLRRIVANTVGWGIPPKTRSKRINELWKLWGETTQCDAAGRLNFYGLQRLAMRTVVESGEVLIRRRWRRPGDGLAVPMQLQILEPDFIDSGRDGVRGEAGGPIIQGVEFDAIGRRVAYWLFDQHPGGTTAVSPISRRIPADGILHVFDQERPGQVRGPSWFASVDVRLHDFDEFEDATLMKSKIAACMAAFVTDMGDGGVSGALGLAGTDAASGQATDTFEPGMIIPLPPGKQVTVANPPATNDHQSFSASALRGVAAGLGVTYEDLCGDYSQVNYSSARMSRLAHQGDIDDWRWNMLIPQFCVPAWDWMIQAMLLAGEQVDASPAEWSPAPMPILEPDKEGLAYQRLVRIGARTWPQMIRELGYDPRDQLDEIESFNKDLDLRGIALDCDPRKLTASGQQQSGGPAAPAKPIGKPDAVDSAGDETPADESAPEPSDA